VRLGKRLGFGEAGEALPVLHDLAEAEAGLAQCGRDVLGERRREAEHDGFLAFVAQPGFMREGAPTERGPLLALVPVAGAIAQREQRAVEFVGIEIEQAGLVDQTAGQSSVHWRIFQLPLGDVLLTEVDPGDSCDFGVEWPGADLLAIVVDDVDSTDGDAVAWRIEFQQLHRVPRVCLTAGDGMSGSVLVQSTKWRFRMWADGVLS
jgi:hypothetical protein